MTRQQTYLRQALDDVTRVKDGLVLDNVKVDEKLYGGLCHTFPVLIHADGLCQTLAFFEAKTKAGASTASQQRAAAYKAVLDHAAALLGQPSRNVLVQQVPNWPLGEYMRHTRTLLDAWVYYKRFAVSVLDVKAGEQDTKE